MMKNQNTTVASKEKSLQYCISRILAGGIFVIANTSDARAEEAGLPVSINAVPGNPAAINVLTSSALHPGIDVGHAVGSISADGQKLTVNQTTDKVVLDWKSFNIAAGKSVQFVQPGSSSVALNNIHQVDASRIFGKLSANGQVYLVNANGFVFGKDSSVNANSLVATNLKISDAVFQQGISKVVDSSPNHDPVAALSGDGTVYRDTGNGNREKIRILVEKGANIAAANSGRVILAAPEVENDGTITAPDGQVILAAATDKVYLQETDSADLRGLLVEVQTGGDVKNVGKILTERGNTTMMGFAVSQQGIVSASTSVALNGSVRLLAREGAKLVKSQTDQSYALQPTTTVRTAESGDGLGTQATVTMASGSTTSVTLDTSGGTAVDGQSQPKSNIKLEAGRIQMKTGSQITAHGGDVELTASEEPSLALSSTTAGNSSRIVLEKGSSIDVSGVKNVELAMSGNVVDVELRNNELRDAPIQKNGILHGKTVKVDIRKGTPLADISGAVEKIRHSVEERNTAAGKVNLHSEGDVIVQQGADIDVSGGSLHYVGGFVDTTKLIANGSVYDIAKADPNRTYQKILTQRYYQPGYYQGKDVGTVDIKTRGLVLDGNINGGSINGQYQRAIGDWAKGGALSIDTAWSNQNQQDVLFQNNQTYTSLGLEESISTPMYLSNALFGNGLNRLNLNTGGKLTIAKNTNVKLPNAGQLTLQAGEIDLQGSITAPSGSVQLKTNIYNQTSGQLHLAADSAIDTSGIWINDPNDIRKSQTLKSLPLDGGDIDLQAQGDLLMDKGSKLTANGGAWLQSNHTLTAGKGGNISLATVGLQPSSLMLGAELSSYALERGGALSITANDIEVTNSVLDGADTTSLFLPATLLESGGFSSYVLTANAGNLDIADGTQIHLQQRNWQLNSAAMSASSGSNLSGLVHQDFLPDYQRKQVNLSLTLAHNATIAGGYDPQRRINIGHNAAITTDPNATITFTSDANIRINGTLNTPAGAISLTLGLPPSSIDKGYNPNQAIFLEANGHLNAAGTTVWTPNTAGLTLGDVKAGGTVSLSADRGYIVMDKGSSIDVSGTHAGLDIVNSRGRTRQNIAANAGTINLAAAEGMLLQGQFLAKAGQGQTAAGNGWSAAGGSLNLELNAQHRGEPEGVVFNTADRVIHVSAEPSAWPDSAVNGQAYISAAQISQAGFDRLKLASSVMEPAQYSASPAVPERGEIRFDGDVSLSLKQSLELDAPLISHYWNGSDVSGQVLLTANTFSLGSSWNRAAHGNLSDPSLANNQGKEAVFSVTANNIDLHGSSEISGFAITQFNSSGDIRLIGVNPNSEKDLVGSLTLTGELDLSAREIYPTTLSRFSLTVDAALSPDGLINILPAHGKFATPLSAAGQLNISAPKIVSAGNLLAPFGEINLTADKSLTLAAGSLTSVSDDSGTLIPLGRTQGGLDWIYPLGLYSNIQIGTPQKAISLSSPDIDLANGAQINLNGGGNLSSFEFIAGPGGSIDYLDAGSAGYQQNYAILPSLQAGYAPYDPLEFSGSGLTLGDSIYLSANSGLPAGNYVLLPAHYALLPGAYLVTPQSASTDMAADTSARRVDGANIVAGYRYSAGTNVADSRWSGFVVESGNVARTRSEYQETTASRFFQAKGVLPQDAGNLSLLAGQRLELAAKISATAAIGGLGGMLDISANQLSVVRQRDDSTAIAGGVVLLADELNNLGVDSILLGGKRSRGNSRTQLTVSAQTVDIAANVHLQAPEILLAATDSVVLETGADISAVGSLSKSDSIFDIANAASSSTDGALLRVSNAGQASVLRAAAGLSRQTGTLNIAENTQLTSSGSILLDAGKDTVFNGNIVMDKGELTLSSSLITLGGVGTGHGLNLSESALNQLHADSLTLNSYSTVDMISAMNLQLRNLTIDAAGIYGYGSAGQIAAINANNITLQNSHGATAGQEGSGQGLLNLKADTITLGAGNYALTGFGQVQLDAQSSLLNSGSSTITAASDVRITTPLWTAASGADTRLNLGQHNLATIADGHAPKTTTALGARLSVTANQIDHQGRIELASGVVKLDAAQNLNIAGSIDTSGRVIDLAANYLYSGGGAIGLTAGQGDVNIQSGATLNVSGSSLGADAGNVVLSAANGSVILNGSVSAHAYQGAKGGSFSLDARNAPYASFSGLNGFLQNAGFEGDISIRQRQGDLTVAADDHVNADNIKLTADSGLLNIFGSLDVSGDQAGSIQLAAGDKVQIHSGSHLNAVSQGSENKGGKVLLTSIDADGDGQQGVSVADGAGIDVSGTGAGHGGLVEVIVNRLGNNDAAVAIDGSTIHGADTMKVEAMAHYLDIPLSNTQIQQWRNDTQSYMDAVGQNAGFQARLGGFALQPGLDIQSTGSLTLDLSESLIGNTWVSQDSKIWTTQLSDVAGLIGSLQQINGTGAVKNLTAAGSSLLNTDGTYYFDSNPDSATFRQLFVRIFPNSGSAAVKYNPSKIAGNLVEHNGWDLELPTMQGKNWRFGDSQTPGLLSLRSAADVTINQTLSDGFAMYDASQLAGLLGTSANWLPTQVLQTGPSWSYNIVAGADLQSANLSDVQASTHTGALTIGSNTSVRTGTGNINMASAGDIVLTDWTSTVYTAGRAAESQRYGSFSNNLVAASFFVEYPFDGGDVALTAGGSIFGASTPQFMSDWLQRTGNWNPSNGISSADRATAWGIAFDGLVVQNSANANIQNLKFGFRENVGALGGGNVSIHAGADIQDLSVMLPSSAKPVGKVENGVITENVRQQQGGGNLEVTAGGDIAGGVFYVDKGHANLSAKGAITGGTQFSSGPIFAMGDAQFNIKAGSGIEVGSVLNPFVLTEPKFLDKTSYFTTYSQNSGINLQSLAGDIRLNNDTALIQQQYKIFDQTSPKGRSILTSASFPLLSLYPGNLTAYALTGGLQITDSMALYPAAGSSLDLKAAGDISIGNASNGVTVNQLDVDPKQLLSIAQPAATINDATKYLYTTPYGGDSATVHAAQPVHQTDTSRNQIISGHGSIIGIGDALIAMAKATEISAGLDLVNLGLKIQNIHTEDVTSVSVGRDIIYPLQRDATTGAVQGSAGEVQLAGPGLLNVWAWRNIDLGSSEGITTVGPLLNSALAKDGADIVVLAGNRLSQDVRPLNDFLQYYVVSGAYKNKLAALSQQPTTTGRLQIALEILFDEIRSAAKAAATSKGEAQQLAYKRGYDAIARLFPNSPSGDIKLFFSRIQTLEGGNINLLAPGGMINAGLASAFTGQKSQAELGIVAQRQGDINILVKGDLQVNQSRVFTLDSGDITVWSSEGNIDAGRGAKSAIATQRPKVSIDANGNLTVEFPATVSGSGIRAQSGYNNDHIGNVTLVAPRGVIDAGEAGIGGHDITIAAAAVIGASNIQAIGNTFGVPQAASTIAVPTGVSNAAAAATKAASSSALENDEDNAKTERAKNAVKMALLDAQIIGFGSCSVSDIRESKKGCGGK